jgi:hypothetical protein
MIEHVRRSTWRIQLSEIEGDHAGGQTEDDELKGRNDTYNN